MSDESHLYKVFLCFLFKSKCHNLPLLLQNYNSPNDELN